MKLKIPVQSYIDYHGEGHEEYLFKCPGCKHDHRIIVNWGVNSLAHHPDNEPRWQFDRNFDKPTFSPSLLIRWTEDLTKAEHARVMAGEKIELKKLCCHSFIKNGQIEFLGDCTHEFAGQTVGMLDY